MTKSSTHSTSTTSDSEMGQRAHSRVTTFQNHSVKVIRAVTIRQSANDLYAFCKNEESLAQVLNQSVAISREDAETAVWSIMLPDNQRAECRVQIINDHPGELLAWSSIEGSEISCAGTLRFEKAMGSESSEIIVTLEYDPPKGKLGALFEKISGQDVGRQLSNALNRLKDAIESGRSSR